MDNILTDEEIAYWKRVRAEPSACAKCEQDSYEKFNTEWGFICYRCELKRRAKKQRKETKYVTSRV
jgi:hypothetical protein